MIITALPKLLLLLKNIADPEETDALPPLRMVALPAVELLLKFTPPEFEIAALPAVAVFAKKREPEFVMAALPAVAVFPKIREPVCKTLSAAFPAELEFWKLSESELPILKVGVLPESFTIPEPVTAKVMNSGPANVKV